MRNAPTKQLDPIRKPFDEFHLFSPVNGDLESLRE
jgi:hypothetical protein